MERLPSKIVQGLVFRDDAGVCFQGLQAEFAVFAGDP